MISSIKIIHDCENNNEVRYDVESKNSLKDDDREKRMNGLVSQTVLESQYENGSVVSSLGKIIFSHGP